jgi:hypothetical protein
VANDKAKSENLVPQADQQASIETAERMGQKGEEAKTINQEKAKEKPERKGG